jgi:hypothetical protein
VDAGPPGRCRLDGAWLKGPVEVSSLGRCSDCGVWSPSYGRRGGFGCLRHECLDRQACQVACAVSGVSFDLSRPPRTWRRWLVFVLLLNPGGPCLFRSYRIELVTVPSSKDSVGAYRVSTVMSSLALLCPCLRRVCRQDPRAVRPPAGSLGGQGRAIGHVEVLERLPVGSVRSLMAWPRQPDTSACLGEVSICSEAIWTRCPTGERPSEAVFGPSLQAEVPEGLDGARQVAGIAPARAF